LRWKHVKKVDWITSLQAIDADRRDRNLEDHDPEDELFRK